MRLEERRGHGLLYRWDGCSYTGNEMKFSTTRSVFAWSTTLGLLLASGGRGSAQVSANPPAQAPAKPAILRAEDSLPFEVKQLETRLRFETNGDSRKEVHTVIELKGEAAAREFARLKFDYDRAFQSVEVPLVRITHKNGGTSEVLPSAVSDAANPAVEKYEGFRDLRVKSVRVMGLQEGDVLEYRVVTTTTKPPYAPNFWVEHGFDRSGQVQSETYEVDIPASATPKLWTSTLGSKYQTRTEGEGATARTIYLWTRGKIEGPAEKPALVSDAEPDVALRSFPDWIGFRSARAGLFPGLRESSPEISRKAAELTAAAKRDREKLELLYDFVSKKIAGLDAPLAATGYAARRPEVVLASGYGTAQDKAALLIALATAAGIPAEPAFSGPGLSNEQDPHTPAEFSSVLVMAKVGSEIWMDPAEGVTPFGAIAAQLRGKPAFLPFGTGDAAFASVTRDLPFAASQKVRVEASLAASGELTAKVKYTIRGDNELLLRMAFAHTAKEKWKEVAGLLALSDGFRGQIATAEISDPADTREAFRVEYELKQSKFVDWTKQPVRIPALLPQIGLPEVPAAGAKAATIELGTPLDVETQMTLTLPAGASAQLPPGTDVARDYASYTSKYSFSGASLTATRHIRFLLREIPETRRADYTAFWRAAQIDQAQLIVLDRSPQ